MAALSANSTVVQVLKDTAQVVVARLFFHATPANDESSVLKINCETLSYRTLTLTHAAVTNGPFQAGEKLVGATSGAIAYFVERSTANQILVTQVTGTFSNTEVVNGTRNPNTTVTMSANTITPARLLSLKSVHWAIVSNNQNVEAKVGLEFANATVFQTALMCSETGEIGEHFSGWVKTKILPTVVSPNGNLYISTYGLPDKGGYEIQVELRKEQGFAEIPTS